MLVSLVLPLCPPLPGHLASCLCPPALNLLCKLQKAVILSRPAPSPGGGEWHLFGRWPTQQTTAGATAWTRQVNQEDTEWSHLSQDSSLRPKWLKGHISSVNENTLQQLKHNIDLILVTVSLPLPTLPWKTTLISPNDKIVNCVDVRTICFYLHKRRLALGLSLGSSAGLPPSAQLYFAANSECPAGSSEGLTARRPLLQADSTPKIAGSFKIECPSAVWKRKRHLYEALWKSHEEIWGSYHSTGIPFFPS